MFRVSGIASFTEVNLVQNGKEVKSQDYVQIGIDLYADGKTVKSLQDLYQLKRKDPSNNLLDPYYRHNGDDDKYDRYSRNQNTNLKRCSNSIISNEDHETTTNINKDKRVKNNNDYYDSIYYDIECQDTVDMNDIEYIKENNENEDNKNNGINGNNGNNGNNVFEIGGNGVDYNKLKIETKKKVRNFSDMLTSFADKVFGTDAITIEQSIKQYNNDTKNIKNKEKQGGYYVQYKEQNIPKRFRDVKYKKLKKNKTKKINKKSNGYGNEYGNGYGNGCGNDYGSQNGYDNGYNEYSEYDDQYNTEMNKFIEYNNNSHHNNSRLNAVVLC